MDPITVIVAALAAGAAAGLTATAEQAVKDAYAGVKQWLQDRYADINLAALERDPKSANRQGVLAEDLAAAGAGEDAELQAQAKALLALLARSQAGREAAAGAGVILRDVEVGQDLTAEEIIASGTGFIGERLKVQGNLTIRGVDAGVGGAADPNA
jgi:hypothetical protein